MPEFNPFSLETLLDPFPAYRWLRETAPVYHVPNTDIWAVSRYCDVDAVLRNHGVFSSTGGVGPEWAPHPMLSMYDPPEHTRLRRVVASHFTPKFVTSFAESIEASVRKYLDPFVDGGGGDFIADFAQPVVASLIADLLGVPEERRSDFRRWSVGIVTILSNRHDLKAAAEADATRAEFVAFLKQVIAERSQTSAAAGNDIISRLMQARADERLTPREVTAFCVLLLVAGFETSVNGIGNLVNAFAEAPHAWDALQSDPSLLKSAIEEGLRYDSPDQAFFRNTLSDATIGDTVIPARSKVMALLGSANRDPAKYPNPDVLDIRRNPTDHVGFGSGVHYCIGAPLARLQYAIIGRALLLRVRALETTAPGKREVNVIVRGFRELQLNVRPK